MASEITLKYLHPSIKTYITTENYNYDTSVAREVLFVADVFEHGADNKLQQVNTLSEYLYKYGSPDIDRFGQAGYNLETWLANGNSAVIMRLLPEDASYAHAVLNIQYKNQTNGKTVINAQGDDTKIDDVYLRPLVTYIGVNNTSEALLDSELNEDRRNYPTTDGYVDNFIFIAYPEGRGEYYNDLGFRIRLNPSYDGVLSSRVYTFEIIRFSGSTYDIVDGPYYVSFDPDAIDPNSQKSMFIENVINSYSDYFKIKFSTENYIKLASVINSEVDPYIIDILSGQSRILSNGEYETFFSEKTGKDEDVHYTLRKYSSNGIALTANGEYILNISNNDETSSDIVDIADNARRVIYNNQKNVTEYMRGYYNWLIQDRIAINLNKIINNNIQNSYDQIGGLLLEKLDNLIYANNINSDSTSYTYNGTEFKSDKVGKEGRNDSWYLKTQEIIQPGLKDLEGDYVGTNLKTGFEKKKNGTSDPSFTSTSQMIDTITEDGYISATNQNLISYYNNFIKYIQFITNYDIFNNDGFVLSSDYLKANKYLDLITRDQAYIYSKINKNKSNDDYTTIGNTGVNLDNLTDEATIPNFSYLAKSYLNSKNNTSGYVSMYDWLVNNVVSDKKPVLNVSNSNGETKNLTLNFYNPNGSRTTGSNSFSYYLPNPEASYDVENQKYRLYPTFIDDTSNKEMYFIPIVNFTTYNSEGTNDEFGKYVKAYNLNGEKFLQPILGSTLTIGSVGGNIIKYDKKTLTPSIKQYLWNDIPNETEIWKIDVDCIVVNTDPEKETTAFNTTFSFGDNSDSNGIEFKFKDYYDLIYKIVNASVFASTGNFDATDLSKYQVITKFAVDGSKTVNGTTSINLASKGYKYYISNPGEFENYQIFKLTDLIKFINDAFIKDYINQTLPNIVDAETFNNLGEKSAIFNIPGTTNFSTLLNIPITSLSVINKSALISYTGSTGLKKAIRITDWNSNADDRNKYQHWSPYGSYRYNISTNQYYRNEPGNNPGSGVPLRYEDISNPSNKPFLFIYGRTKSDLETMLNQQGLTNYFHAGWFVVFSEDFDFTTDSIKDNVTVYRIQGTPGNFTLVVAAESVYKIPTTQTVSTIFTDFYFKASDDDINKNINLPKFNNVFSNYLKNGKLTQAYNKVSTYASLISKELDGKGKETIVEDIEKAKSYKDLDYSKYSLTTILNLLVAGFESIVNNQGSITDYTNYSSLKYLIKSINNSLDLRSTYLTLLNIHRNNLLDLSTELAKNNASVILGEDTLNKLYEAMDQVVLESNYIITNLIFGSINKTFTVKDITELDRADNDKPYAYYFDNNGTAIKQKVDPLGININIDRFGTKDFVYDQSTIYGMLPLLEKILMNITGQNHYGNQIGTIYGGQDLMSIYVDIKEGYLPGGLTQDRYETMYTIIVQSISNLLDCYNVIGSLINEKYISEIINKLIGTLNIDNTVIKYKGSTYSINSLWNLYNEGLDEDLTQTMVINLINDAIEMSDNENLVPIEPISEAPIIQYTYFTMQDILNSQDIAKQNKDIVKSNIQKQDKVLASLNTLCYDNLVTNIYGPLGFAEGSDGSFTYDNSTAAKLKTRQHLINDIRIKAYKGTWNPDVLNKDLYEFDHVFDANYEDPVKNAIITLARDERQDFFFWADTKIQNTINDCLNWKQSFTNSTYFMSVISQSQIWYDEYTSKNITLTSTYLLSRLLCNHLSNFGRQFPMAGSRRGVVGGFISNDWYPNEEQKEKLYNNKINYLERDIATIRIGAQNTNYPNGPLGQINNMLVLLRIKRTVEKIAKTYQFEFNTSETRSVMAAEINNYLTQWINNGACTVATASVYASDYDIIQKIVRVDITLQFTGVIERIVINIDCPASI